MEEKLMLKIASPEDSPAVIPYSSLIGSLNYCALFTRPDISFAANKCTQYSSKLTLEHWAAATRTLQYLIHTKNYGITYKCDGIGLDDYDHHLVGYTNANYAGDVDFYCNIFAFLFDIKGLNILCILEAVRGICTYV